MVVQKLVFAFLALALSDGACADELDDLLNAYPKKAIIAEIIDQSDGTVTIESKGKMKLWLGPPNPDLVNKNTVQKDLERLGITTEEFRAALSKEQQPDAVARESQNKKAEYEQKAHSRRETRKRALEEQWAAWADQVKKRKLASGTFPTDYRSTVEDWIKKNFLDPYSVRDLDIGVPQPEGPIGALPDGDLASVPWTVVFSSNSKNRLGAYSGNITRKCIFDDIGGIIDCFSIKQ